MYVALCFCTKLHSSLNPVVFSFALPSTLLHPGYAFSTINIHLEGSSPTLFSVKPTPSLLPGGDHSPFLPNFSTLPTFQAVRLVFIHCFMVMLCRLNSFICFMYSVVTYLKNRFARVFSITVFLFLFTVILF